MAINFVTKEDERLLQDIQKFYNTVVEVSGEGGGGIVGWVGGGCIFGAWGAAPRVAHARSPPLPPSPPRSSSPCPPPPPHPTPQELPSNIADLI